MTDWLSVRANASAPLRTARASGVLNRSMRADAPTFHGSYALHLLQLVERWDVSADAMLDGLDLDVEELSDPRTYVPLTAARTLVERAFALTEEPALGFFMGTTLRLSTHGYLGFAALAAKNVSGALAVAERFVSTRTDALRFVSRRDGARVALTVEVNPALGDTFTTFLVGTVFVTIAYAAELITQRRLEGVAEVTFAERPEFARFHGVLHGDIRYGQPTNRLVFDASILDLPLVMADEAASRLAIEQCEAELSRMSDLEPAVAEVRRHLPTEGGFRSLESVASRMHVSPRTLKRKLASAGTSFSQLLDEMRRVRAEALLQDRSLGLEDIAARLGYANAANFSRAFRRWTGRTPRSS